MGRGPQQAQSEGSAHRPESRHTEEEEPTPHPPAGLTRKQIKEIRRDGPKAEATAAKAEVAAPGDGGAIDAILRTQTWIRHPSGLSRWTEPYRTTGKSPASHGG